ncbi:MAG: class I SAM-dependent methyltransferase [Gaiellales bacterium]|nr:MAG: class I SAM-dependent methyltransferase [Gaiellales bacterium]
MTSYYRYYFESGEIDGSAERILAKNELVYEFLKPHLAPGCAVLELGVGKGYFARVCTEHGHSYRGVEANEDQCRALADEGMEVTCGAVPPVPVEDERFGLVYCAHLLEHLPDSRAVHALMADCRRLVDDGGVIALLFPDAMAMGRQFWNCDYTHVYPTTERRIAQALADSGYEVLAGHRLSGHYTGARRLLARAVGSRPLTLRVAQAVARDPQRQDLFYRGWMYLQQDILLMARPLG